MWSGVESNRNPLHEIDARRELKADNALQLRHGRVGVLRELMIARGVAAQLPVLAISQSAQIVGEYLLNDGRRPVFFRTSTHAWKGYAGVRP